MSRLILFDGRYRNRLLPFTFIQPVALLRVGMLTISEKWEHDTGASVSYAPADYLKEKFPPQPDNDNFFVEGNLLPDPDLVDLIFNLSINSIILYEGKMIAGRLDESNSEKFTSCRPLEVKEVNADFNPRLICEKWDLFTQNGTEIEHDLKRLKPPEAPAAFRESNFISGTGGFYAEETSHCRYAFIDTSNGPVYLMENATVQEGAMIKGPVVLGPNSTIKMGAKIYGPTTIGPWCKAGGEINNSIMHSFSNKAHDGFLGNAVIGSWCNIGADSNNSNLKNNYEEVKVWDYESERFASTGLNFCGLFMGDHSKCGINTMFNTGTTTGLSANIYGSGFPRTFLPSFSWGGASGIKEFRLEKACETASRMMERRDVQFTDHDYNIFEYVFNQTKKFRK